jgi:hypothetical protein
LFAGGHFSAPTNFLAAVDLSTLSAYYLQADLEIDLAETH